MFRCLFFLMCALFSVSSMSNNLDFPIVRSIKEGDKCKILFNDKTVSHHVCKDELPSFLRSYSLLTNSWVGVWIFQDSQIGNACDGGLIRVISLDSHNNAKEYSPIDYCIGGIVIQNSNDIVEIDVQTDPDTKEYEVWIFNNLTLTKRK